MKGGYLFIIRNENSFLKKFLGTKEILLEFIIIKESKYEILRIGYILLFYKKKRNYQNIFSGLIIRKQERVFLQAYAFQQPIEFFPF